MATLIQNQVFKKKSKTKNNSIHHFDFSFKVDSALRGLSSSYKQKKPVVFFLRCSTPIMFGVQKVAKIGAMGNQSTTCQRSVNIDPSQHQKLQKKNNNSKSALVGCQFIWSIVFLSSALRPLMYGEAFFARFQFFCLFCLLINHTAAQHCCLCVLSSGAGIVCVGQSEAPASLPTNGEGKGEGEGD